MNDPLEQRLAQIAEENGLPEHEAGVDWYFMRLGVKAAQEWYQIESAPKNGERFIAYEPGHGVHECWWDDEHDASGGFRNPWHGWAPTLWKPLPLPPKVKP